MTTPKGPNNFSSLTSSIINASAPASAPAPATKAKLMSFHLEPELRQPLDRVVYQRGRKSSFRSIINEALRYYFEHHPDAQRQVTLPTPDEQ